jgi:hypothetical protein
LVSQVRPFFGGQYMRPLWLSQSSALFIATLNLVLTIYIQARKCVLVINTKGICRGFCFEVMLCKTITWIS